MKNVSKLVGFMCFNFHIKTFRQTFHLCSNYENEIIIANVNFLLMASSVKKSAFTPLADCRLKSGTLGNNYFYFDNPIESISNLNLIFNEEIVSFLLPLLWRSFIGLCIRFNQNSNYVFNWIRLWVWFFLFGSRLRV